MTAAAFLFLSTKSMKK